MTQNGGTGKRRLRPMPHSFPAAETSAAARALNLRSDSLFSAFPDLMAAIPVRRHLLEAPAVIRLMNRSTSLARPGELEDEGMQCRIGSVRAHEGAEAKRASAFDPMSPPLPTTFDEAQFPAPVLPRRW